MADLAVPLPVRIIAEMLGVEPADYPKFKLWSDSLIEGSNTGPGAPMPDGVRRAFIDARAYFAAEIEKRRRAPTTDLISTLVAAHDGDGALTSAELMAFIILLLIAGNETTTNLLGNGVLALGKNPDQLALLRRNPALLPCAIEEMLRYDSPVQSTFRTVKCDCEVGGTRLAEGTMVFTVIGAGNRDPARFPAPERFDIARTPNDHLAFGEGIHFCLGSTLARLEARVALSRVLSRFPRLRLADPAMTPRYRGSFFVRGLRELPMLLD
jgi:cytochrome P450